MAVMRSITYAVCLFLLMGPAAGPAFAISPSNVLVLYNTDSPEGTEVVSHYLQAHPGVQSLGLTNVPVAEEVLWSVYLGTIRPQVLSALTDSIDCIVTTKGLPLRIYNPKASPFVFTWKEYSSLESELTRIDSIDSRDLMGRQGWQYSPPYGNPLAANPFYYQDGPFDFQTYGIRLTSRLDGFTVQEITDSIDRAGRAILRPGSHFLVDDDPNAPGACADRMEQLVSGVLVPRGLQHTYDGSDAFVTDAPAPLLGYVGHGVHGGAPPDYLANPASGGLTVDVADGGVFHTWESFNAYTFDANAVDQMPSRQGLVAEWLSRGGTAGVGHVQEPGVDDTNVTHEDRLFDRLIAGYTWVEAAWNATRQLSYVNTVVGDPLMVWSEWSPGDDDPTIEVQTEDGLDWVYQNTALTLFNGGHKVALAVSVLDLNGNTSVGLTVQKKAGSGPGEVAVEDTADPLVKQIVGSLRTDGLANCGNLTLEIAVTGDVAGQTVVEVPFTCRRLGDCDGNGGAEPGDVSAIIMMLNGRPPLGYKERAFDIDANGAAEPKDVLILINILSGRPIP